MSPSRNSPRTARDTSRSIPAHRATSSPAVCDNRIPRQLIQLLGARSLVVIPRNLGFSSTIDSIVSLMDARAYGDDFSKNSKINSAFSVVPLRAFALASPRASSLLARRVAPRTKTARNTATRLALPVIAAVPRHRTRSAPRTRPKARIRRRRRHHSSPRSSSSRRSSRRSRRVVVR